MPSGIQVGWGSRWETLANAINDYYGGGISSAQYQQVVQMLNSGNYTMQEMESVIGNIPEFERTYNAAGQLTGVSYKATAAGNTAAGAAANAVNSNVAGATQTQFQTVQTITKDAQTGTVTMSDNVTKYTAGTAGTAKAVASSAVAAVCAASVGITLGKTIDSVLYNLNPDFWDDNGMYALNPETWSSITAGENDLGSKLFNFVFQIDENTGNPQAYIDQNTFAYMAAYMASCGVFDTGDIHGTIPLDNPYSLPTFNYVTFPAHLKRADETITTVTSNTPNVRVFRNATTFTIATNSPISSLIYTSHAANGDELTSTISNFNSYTYDNKTVYWNTGNFNYVSVAKNTELINPNLVAYADQERAAWAIVYGGYDEGGGGVDGITPQDGATQFNPSGIDPTDIAAILAALQTQYPNLWNNRIEVSPDGETTINYIPVGFPTGGTGSQPTTDGATANDLAPDISGDGDNVTDELIKTLIDMIQNPQEKSGMESDTTTPTEPIDPNMPNGGSGITPPFVIPTGSA